jgi:hypothetical protein
MALIASSVFEPATLAPLVFRNGRLLEMLAIMVPDISSVPWANSTSPGWHDQPVTRGLKWSKKYMNRFLIDEEKT